jgi:hypothetical protein
MTDLNNNDKENKEDKENDVIDVYNKPNEEYPKDKSKDVKGDKRKEHTRICPRCKQPYQTKIGVDNWKNLFKMPTMEDWITLIILILLIAAAFAYTTETKACKDTLNNLDEICLKRANNVNYTGNGVPYIPNTIFNESTSEVNSSNDSSSNLPDNWTYYSNITHITYVNYSSNLTNQTQNLSNVSR